MWRDIKGYEGSYKISSTGKVMSLKRKGRRSNRILKLSYDKKDNYLQIGLSKDGEMKNYQVHRLIAQAFIPNPNNLPQTNHKNGIKDDNRVENLEWVTASENQLHSYRILGNISVGGSCWKGKFGKNHNRSIPIGKYSLDGQLLETFEGIKDAHRKTGLSASLIGGVCNNSRNKTGGGFIWKKLEKK